MDDLRAQKDRLRQQMLMQRAAARHEKPNANLLLRDRFLKSIFLPAGSLIASYSAQGDEIDPLPLTRALLIAGHRLCLPTIVGKNMPLRFRAWSGGEALVPGVWQIPEPPLTAPVVEPTVLLVPLLAFDRRGNRLGYGGGYYDRSLALLREGQKIIAIGLAYVAQEVLAIPAGSEDTRLDAVATENEVFWPKNP